MNEISPIKEYTPQWTEKFNVESELIKNTLIEELKDIQHIGSTSIPGMIAKPLIDIGVLVDSIDDISIFVQKLEPLGYEHKPNMSSPERIFFRKGSPVEYHLSITGPAYGFWKRQILFREYLRNHPEAVEEYNALKMKNIETTPAEDFKDLSVSESYNKGKDEFVARILKLVETED